jgi:hypothetical protein
MRLALGIAVFALPLMADLATIRTEKNLEKRSRLALDHADHELKESRKAYHDGDLDRTAALLAEVGEAVALAEESLKETGKNPSRSPKHFKHAEIKTGDLLRKIDAFTRDMSYVDRPMTEKLKKSVEETHDRLLQGIMTGKKR